MLKPLFSGVCTALVTPFQDGQVNHAMLKALIQRQLEAGIRAIVLCGTTGEAPTLSDEEKLSIFQTARDCMPGDALLIAGTGSNNTEHTVSLSIRARECGADALLVVAPYYNKTNPQGLFAHYRAVADGAKLPIILYNVPSRTGVDIPIALYRSLSQTDCIAGVKEASTDIRKIAGILENCPPDFSVWSGNDDMTVPVMALGGLGVISVASNLVPARMHRMTREALAGNYRNAGEQQLALLPLLRALFCDSNPIPVKAAMKYIGLDCGSCRLPLTDLDKGKTRTLLQALDQVLNPA